MAIFANLLDFLVQERIYSSKIHLYEYIQIKCFLWVKILNPKRASLRSKEPMFSFYVPRRCQGLIS